jgi:hypothetical protein
MSLSTVVEPHPTIADMARPGRRLFGDDGLARMYESGR